jgi:AraC-like DNA-binding protein
MSSFPWATAVMFMGALQGLLLAAALWRTKNRGSRANRLLALLMLLTAVRLSTVAFVRLQPAPARWDWSLPLILTFSPLLYLYCRALLEPGAWRRRAGLIHFAPALLWTVWRTVEALIPSEAAGPTPAPGAWLSSFLPDILWLAQTSAYLLLILGLLRRHAGKSPRVLSDSDSIRLTWMRVLAAAFGFLCALIVVFLAGNALGLRFIKPSNALLYITVAAIVYLWGWFGLRQPEIFAAPAAGAEARPAERETIAAPPAAAGLSRLLRVMDERTPYLDPSLTLQDLARASGLPPYQLTAILNGTLGQTFYEFVNRRRIEEAKRKLADPACDHIKILAVALDSGFASKSAFNRVFRDITGLTPSAYRKSPRQAGPSR